jgi:uncharacterized protein YndB with AHSA1/START domain
MTALQDIAAEIRIEAPRERVWTVLTGEGQIEQWLGCLGYRAEIGALFHMQPDPGKRAAGNVEGATHCELLALEPPERMRFSWFMPGTPKTEVEIVLTGNDDGSTTARLVHSGWDRLEPDQVRAIRDMLEGGWTSFVLPGLKRVAEAC